MERLKLLMEMPGDLNTGLKNRLEANALHVLACPLNVVGENVSLFCDFRKGEGKPFRRLVSTISFRILFL